MLPSKVIHFWLVMITSLGCMNVGVTLAQDSATAEDLRKGHRLAAELCSICHLATPDQAAQPMLNPPAPPFEQILVREHLSAEWLTHFLETTHRGLDRPNGMPSPELADFQIKQVVAYLMSRYDK
jgi:mono/diheme cytochrome c family protein